MFKRFRGKKGSPQREEVGDSWSYFSTPKISKGEKNNNKYNKNPYSMVGRDKFATVLADLDEKRRTIYEQVGTQDISKVRFEYHDSKEWVPIVVRSSNEQIVDKTKLVPSRDKHVSHISETLSKSQITPKVEKEIEQPSDVDVSTIKKNLNAGYDFQNYLNKGTQSCYDFPLVFVLVLSCLGNYGRLLAAICTLVWWFLVPRMKNKVVLKDLMKRKEYERKLSEKSKHSEVMPSFPRNRNLSQESLSPRISSPRSNLRYGLSPGHHHHVNSKSW